MKNTTKNLLINLFLIFIFSVAMSELFKYYKVHYIVGFFCCIILGASWKHIKFFE